jgi:hypothetical protein
MDQAIKIMQECDDSKRKKFLERMIDKAKKAKARSQQLDRVYNEIIYYITSDQRSEFYKDQNNFLCTNK